jgi:hypothetical protein
MKKIFGYSTIIIIVLIAIITTTGCSSTNTEPKESKEGYWKISMTVDLNVYSDGSIDHQGGGPGACFAEGFIASVMYFPFDGGELIAQDSYVSMTDVSCLSCESEIVSNSLEVPIELKAVLDLNAAKVTKKNGAQFLYEDFRVWMEKPLMFPVDIEYTCEGPPGVSSDYGGYMSQLVTPFLTQVWSIQPTFGEIYTTSFEGYAFPPTYLADIKFNIIEEYSKTINISAR